MEFIYVMMLVFMTGTFCIISFLIGMLGSGEKKKVTLNPIKAYKEQKEEEKKEEEKKKKVDLENRRTKVMLENIENYPYKQKEIPNE